MKKFLLLLMIFASCAVKNSSETKTDSSEMTGLWRVVRNDSIYNEAIIQDTILIGIDEYQNLHRRTIRVEGDSIRIRGRNVDFALKFRKIDGDNFVLENARVKTHYQRMRVDGIDPDKIGKAEIDSLLVHFPSRRAGWDAQR